jgi:drug/metabolite transporter (DMT)-like permease
MLVNRTSWAAYGSTASFVLLWSSGAIFSRLGLDHASTFILLVLRFTVACGVLLLASRVLRQPWLPRAGTRVRVAVTGSLMIGGYSNCYFLALEHGITPGVLATILGVQPILTLVLLERRFPLPRLIGLTLAFGGLVLVVYQSMEMAHLSRWGTLFALGALASATIGAILQKRVSQPPVQILPLQYGVSGLLSLALIPSQASHLEYGIGLLIPLLWLGVVISVIAQLLLYRLIHHDNLVNVTSLFYLVPVVTAAMDYLFLGNRLSSISLMGMVAIVLGLSVVFRASRPSSPGQTAVAK